MEDDFYKVNQSSKLVRIIKFDKFISAKIHKLHLPLILQVWIWFWAVVFNKEGNLIVMMIVATIFPRYLSDP